MATGALDSNGIWQYGEDDSETTFSLLLNKLGGSTSAQIAKQNDYKCILGNTVAQSLTTTLTAHTWSVELYDPKGMHAAGSASVVAPFTGVYRVTYALTGATTASVVDIYALLNVNGTDLIYTQTGASGNNQSPVAFWSGIVLVTAGNNIQVKRATTYGPGYNNIQTRDYFAVEYLGKQA